MGCGVEMATGGVYAGSAESGPVLEAILFRKSGG